MTLSLIAKSKSAINCLYIFCSILMFLALLYDHFQLVTYEMPLDQIEAIMPSHAALFAALDSPYSFDNQPARNYGYTPLSHIAVAPLTKIFGNTLPLHRAFGGVLILATCLLCYVLAKKESHSRQNSFAVAVLVYAGFLYGSTPIASPNGLGLLLFFSCISIPWLTGFSNRNLCVCLILGILAFYTKQYFLACLGYVALYLFLAVSKWKGIIFGVVALVTFITSIVIVHSTSPYFLDHILFSQMAVGTLIFSEGYLVKQLLNYAQIYFPILLILGVLALEALWNSYSQMRERASAGPAGQRNAQNALFNLKDLDAPLLSWKPNYIWLCFLCSLAIIIFYLGKNPANHLVYLFQFLSPFLLTGTLVLVSKSMRLKWLYQLLLIWAFYNSYAMLPHDYSMDHKNWDRLKEVVSQSEMVYATPIILGELVEAGKPIHHNGNNRYFPFAQIKPSFLVKENPEETIGRIWDKYVDRTYAMIEKQEFDLILLDVWNPLPQRWAYTPNPPTDVELARGTELLNKYYQCNEVIELSLVNRPGREKATIQVWTPKPESSRLNNSEL